MSDPLPTADPANPKTAMLVVAPPGCGKTELLGRRADYLINTLRPGQRILALTFSNKAKANLNERLIRLLGYERKRRYVAVHNFHGHAAEIVRSHGHMLGISSDTPMPDKKTQDSYIAPHLEQVLEKDAGALRSLIDDELREAKRGPYDEVAVLQRLAREGDPRTIKVEEQRQVDGVLFYDDLLRHAQRLLRIEGVARLLRAHYGAVMVDEFQDLSPQQLDIALRSCDTSRTFVGDPLQGIYSWAGARPVTVERIIHRIGAAPEGLGVSYRSSPKVLYVLGLVSQTLGGQQLLSHEPEAWFEEGMAAGIAFETGADEARFIRTTSQTIQAGDATATVGVICRNGWRRKPIDTEFASSRTPCTRWDLAIDNADIIKIISDAAVRLGGSPDLAAIEVEALRGIPADDIDTVSDVRDALRQLEESVTEAGSVTAALNQLRVRDDTTRAIAPGIHLLNAHTGKGQQFDWVFIPGFEKGNMPSFLAKTRAEVEEELRVLLVMLSRAKHGVVISRASQLISKKGNPYNPDPSPWIPIVRAGLMTDRSLLVAHIVKLQANAQDVTRESIATQSRATQGPCGPLPDNALGTVD